MKILDDDGFELSTGRIFTANEHIIGLSPTENLEAYPCPLFEGWDWTIDIDFTPGEKIEIADFMIRQWEHYKLLAEKQKSNPDFVNDPYYLR